MSLQKQPKAETDYRLQCSFQIEKQIQKDFVVGADEAGRGPIAGPVVAAMLCFPKSAYEDSSAEMAMIQDSKKLSASKRKMLVPWIYENALWVKVGFVDSDRVDKINILQATFEAFRKCYQAACSDGRKIDIVLVDGNQQIPGLQVAQRCVIGGDRFSKSIAAASIIAKEARDDFMREAHEKYPQYNFEKHKGYGTKAHWEALEEHGPIDMHRTSFLKKYFNRKTGIGAESEAENFLLRQGFAIREKNWSSKIGEIDLIAEKDDHLHFVEVRHRKSKDFDLAFPPSKQLQVKRAVQSYLSFQKHASTRAPSIHIDFICVVGKEIHPFWDVFKF